MMMMVQCCGPVMDTRAVAEVKNEASIVIANEENEESERGGDRGVRIMG